MESFTPSRAALFLVILCYNLLTFSSCITLFDKSKSYAIFDVWNITEVGKLELKFKTQSTYCMVLYIDSNHIDSAAVNSGVSREKDSFLEVALIQGRIEVTQQIMSNKYNKKITIGEHLNDLEWHYLRITKFIGTLQIEIDREMKILNFPNDIGEQFRIESRLYIGGMSKNKQSAAFGSVKFMPRFFGCIEELKYASGSLVTKPALRVLKGESVAAKCLNTCGINPCKNSGKCINLFTRASCDCFGTGYDGDRCTTPSEAIHVQEKDHIKWGLKDSTAAKSRLSLKFRFKAAQANGVIFYTKRRGTIVSVELVEGRLRIAGGKTTEIPKDITLKHNLFDAKWHSAVITLTLNTISVSLDNRRHVNLTITTEDADTAEENEPVFFGGVDSKYTFGVVSRNNFVGCLQQVLYNKIDVIYKVKHTINKYIQNVGNIKPGCPYNRTNINIPTETPVTTTENNVFIGKKETVIKEIHTREGGMGQNVIIWITAAIVIGTIVILISAACVVHHVRMRYHQTKAQQQQEEKDSAIYDENDDMTPMKEIEPDEKSNDSTSRSGTPTINNANVRQCKENDEHAYMIHNAEGEISEV